MIAAAALLTAVVYVFTPLTAAGQEGSPTGFFTNTRYLMPGLILALALLPSRGPARARPARLADAALPHRRLRDHGADHAALVPELHRRHRLPHPRAGLGAGGLAMARSRAPRQPSGGAGGRRGPGAIRGRPRPRPAGPVRRAALLNPDAVPRGRRAAAKPTSSPTSLHDKRIGIAGSGEIFFGQYGFYGGDLDNYVEYIGVKGPHGTYRLATTCAQFRSLVNAGDYDYLVISQFTQDTGQRVPNPYQFPVYGWVKGDPAGKLVVDDQARLAAARLRLQGHWQARPIGLQAGKAPEVPGEIE